MQLPLDSSPIRPGPRTLQADHEPVFNAPWEAKAFAMVKQLATLEHWTWPEWTQYLSSEIAAAETAAPGAVAYYEQWVRACEKLLADKGLLDAEAIQQRIQELLAEQEKEHPHS